MNREQKRTLQIDFECSWKQEHRKTIQRAFKEQTDRQIPTDTQILFRNASEYS